MTTEEVGAESHTETELEAPFIWDWALFLRCARTFVTTTVVVFVLGVAVGAYAPGVPSSVLRILETINLWPTAYLSHLVPMFFFILLGNIKSVLIAAVLGTLGAWANARANTRRGVHHASSCQRLTAVDRSTLTLARLVLRGGRRVFPELGDERCDFAARIGAALASLVPLLAIGVNGLVLGLWMAEALLSDWWAGVAQVGILLLPHAPLEVPVFLLASAAGLRLAEGLVPRDPIRHDTEWQCLQARRLLTAEPLAQSLGLIIGLLAIAAALELYALSA